MSADVATKSSLSGRHVVLGVSGGIASYKACYVARALTEAGAAVDVVLTSSAAQFVRPVTFEALTGRRVLESLWEPGGSLDHIRWAKDPDLIVLAPATANLIARAALGLADDFLTTMLLARTGDVLVAPAMNDEMYANPMTQENIERLRGRGWHFVGPAVGALAEGPSDRPGRMEDPEHIVSQATRIVRQKNGVWCGRRVLVTAAATREELDPVRVITNRSSGRMGYAVAQAAFERGADVYLVTGPNSLAPPWGVTVERVESTQDMLDAVATQLPSSDVLVMAAAPADFRPTDRSGSKRARTDGPMTLDVTGTPDILQSTRKARKKGAIVVGFALETSGGLERAKEKLAQKGLDFIALNFATEPGAGFESDTNRVTLISRSGILEIPKMSKRAVADKILEAVEVSIG